MKDLTDITFILDRSGSMQDLKSDVIGGFAQFVEEQQKVGGNAVLSLVQFDDQYESVFSSMPIANVSPKLNFQPRGMTALRDAVGRTVNAIGNRLANLPESERPSKVIIAIFTDGYENASHEFSQQQIKDMIEHQQGKYQWKFLFLGANIDSFAAAQSYGISSLTMTNYKPSSLGMRSAIGAMCSYTSSVRSGATPQALNAIYQKTEDELANNVTITSGSSGSSGTASSK